VSNTKDATWTETWRSPEEKQMRVRPTPEADLYAGRISAQQFAKIL
jgi:hypothetical protein